MLYYFDPRGSKFEMWACQIQTAVDKEAVSHLVRIVYLRCELANILATSLKVQAAQMS